MPKKQKTNFKNNFVIFDLETSDKDPFTCYALEISALAIDNHTLEIIDGGIFESRMRPPLTDEQILDINGPIKDEALAVNGIKRKEILDAPKESLVWTNFINYTKSYTTGRAPWGNPVAIGHNIRKFDDIIVNRLCETYNTKYPFHPRDYIDTLNMMYLWLESVEGIDKYGMDSLRAFLGLDNADKGSSHTAGRDCYDTYEIFRRFLGWMRKLAKKAKFKRSFYKKDINHDNQTTETNNS
jgi:DNA polymerase III epsilon subunit-like protein